ncbi:MAG: sulfite reductase [Thermodesulfovibrio sp. RBG_19FT_COMBO_42_12]|nr:MAG: sulfite reductase [Thermodesulfovibrio sp. RBG_19FT_COMBO_42_12]
MGKEEIRQTIIEYATKSAKSKFYFKDMLTGVKKVIPDAVTSDIKNVASELVREGVMELFSTGSSTMYGLKGRGISVEKSGDSGG